MEEEEAPQPQPHLRLEVPMDGLAKVDGTVRSHPEWMHHHMAQHQHRTHTVRRQGEHGLKLLPPKLGQDQLLTVWMRTTVRLQSEHPVFQAQDRP